MYSAIKKTWYRYLLGHFPTFGGSLFSGYLRSHKVLTFPSESRYFLGGGGGVVTIGILLYDVSTIPCRHYNVQIFRIINNYSPKAK